MAQVCIEQLLASGAQNDVSGTPDQARKAASSELRCARHETSGDLEAAQAWLRERRWGDGLPLIPPTVERVERMLARNGCAAETAVASIAPGFGAATLEAIAANAVMAGCSPEHLPLLVAAVKAVAEPQFNLQGIQATTNPVAVWVVVNGPAADQLGINAAINCLGQGAWANAALGRALLGSSLFTRHVVIDRWFLRVQRRGSGLGARHSRWYPEVAGANSSSSLPLRTTGSAEPRARTPSPDS